LVGVTNGFSIGLPKTLLPIYTLSANWSLTPKLALNVSASKSIAPPTTVIANAEQSYNASLGLTYQLTPKVTLSANGSIGYSTSSFTATAAQAAVSPFFFDTQNIYTVSAGMTYDMTPFLSAALNASYNERATRPFITAQDVVTVSLSYRPH
jgi:outer membrane receptor protein involved in Fe transport